MCTAAVSLQKAGRPCGVADKIADCTTRGVWPLFNYNTFILYSAVVVGCKLLLVAGGHCRIFVALANVLEELGETQTCFWAPNF